MKKFLSCAAVVGLLVASSSSVFARGGVNNGGSNASAVSPGHEMKGSTPAPVPGLNGAAGWAPGQQMRANGSGSGNGASVYAPGFLK